MASLQRGELLLWGTPGFLLDSLLNQPGHIQSRRHLAVAEDGEAADPADLLEDLALRFGALGRVE